MGHMVQIARLIILCVYCAVIISCMNEESPDFTVAKDPEAIHTHIIVLSLIIIPGLFIATTAHMGFTYKIFTTE